MESKKVIVRTIQRLKEIKEEQGLSVSQIMSKMAEKGYPVSESTLKRVFAPGSEKMSFRYQESIAPVAEVLFDEYGDTGATDDAAELRKIIADRDKTIENLMIKIEEQEKSAQQFQKMCSERRTLLESHISDLQEEVELLRSQIEKKDKMFERIMSRLVLREAE
jgi:hypothetical protein